MFDNDGLTVRVTAPNGGLEKGQFFYDKDGNDWAGFVLDTVDAGEEVALEIARGHRFNLPATVAAEAGEVLYVQDDGTLDTTPDAVVRPFMKITEVVENVVTKDEVTYDQVIGVVLSQVWGSNTPTTGS